jgi:predicted GNAT family N-acyltransferase
LIDNLYFISLKELLEEAKSSNEIKKILTTFKCYKNKDIENFLHNKAVTFEKKLRARTYLLILKTHNIKRVAGYFSIAISVLYAKEIEKEILLEIGELNSPKDIPCLLIGQIAKSDEFEKIKLGKYLMELALEKLEQVNEIIGSRFILLDAINKDKLIKFYENFGFVKIEESVEIKKESIKMIKAFYKN